MTPSVPPTSQRPPGRASTRLRYGLVLLPRYPWRLPCGAYVLTSGSGGTDAPSQAVQASPTAVPGAPIIAGAAVEAIEPTPTAVPQAQDVARLVVPSLDIDAPIVALGVDADGAMQAPNNPTDVAWYNFSARPGEIGNIVMAGHLDYVNYGPAVFYHLKDAHLGDELQLVLVDGSVARYRVLNVTSYDEATAPVQDIVGPTDGEVVTLITCGGSFDTLSREYDKRIVLRAERITETAQGN